MKEKIFSGGCLCGNITFEAKGTPANPHTCSCTMCQRQSGAPTLIWVEFARDKVSWTGAGGAPAVWRSSTASSRAFCPTCGSTLGAIDDKPVIAMVTGVFDKPHLLPLKPDYHSYKGKRPKWWHLELR